MDYDLPSVVQHESGHFLGLAHTDQPDALSTVMLPNLDQTVVRRTLQPDDIQGMCAAHPPGTPNPNCDPEPRHGFSTECEFNDKGCCSVAPGRSANHRGSWGTLLLGVALTAAARRRRNSVNLPDLAKTANAGVPPSEARLECRQKHTNPPE